MGLSEEQPPNENPNEVTEEGFDDWSALLEGVEYEEAPAEAPVSENFFQKLLGRFGQHSAEKSDEPKPSTSKKPRKKKGPFSQFKPWQKMVLAGMGIVIIIIYVAIFTIVTTSLPAASQDTPTQNGEEDSLFGIAPTATPIPKADVTPVPTTIPTPTPTATPLPVSTRLDNKININPDNVDLRIERGNLYLELGAYQAALADFERALSVDPENALAYTGIGEVNFYLRHWDQAIGAYQQAIDRDETLTNAHFGLATILYHQNRYEAAAAAFDRAAAINPDYVEAEAWLAISAARAGDVEEAMGAAQRAFSINEDLPLVHIARSWAWRAQDPPDIDAAQGDLLHAQNLEPYAYRTLQALAEFYLSYRPERLVEAENLSQYAYNWAKSDLERAQALHTLGRVYWAQNRTEDARRVLTQAADLVTYQDRVILPDLAETLREVVPEN